MKKYLVTMSVMVHAEDAEHAREQAADMGPDYYIVTEVE